MAMDDSQRSLHVRISAFLRREGFTHSERENIQNDRIKWRPFRDSESFTILLSSAKRDGDGSALVSSVSSKWDHVKVETFDEWMAFYDAFKTHRANWR